MLLQNLCNIVLFLFDMQHQKPSLQVRPTQEELKQRRLQKIIKRSQIVAPQQMPSTHVQIKNQFDSKNANLSAYQMFRTSQQHERNKIQLQIVSIVLGLTIAIVHLFTNLSEYVFAAGFVLLALCTAYLQVVRLSRVSRFTESNQSELDPLISKVSNIKQLQIVNKVLSLQSAFTPITKFLATFFLVIVLFGCLSFRQII